MLNALSKLTELVLGVCPIDGIADLGDGQYRIDFREDASGQQRQEAQAVVDNWPLTESKLVKLDKIDEEWGQRLAAGWDCGKGHLGFLAEDVALLAGNFALAKESAALGGTIPPLITKENNIISFNSIQDLTMLMLAYGQARSMLSLEFAAKSKAVENATTMLELEAIS